MAVVKLKDYSVAKKFKEDFANIHKVIDLASRGLSHYKKYKPVSTLVSEMNNQLAILQAHMRTAEKILSKDEEK